LLLLFSSSSAALLVTYIPSLLSPPPLSPPVITSLHSSSSSKPPRSLWSCQGSPPPPLSPFACFPFYLLHTLRFQINRLFFPVSVPPRPSTPSPVRDSPKSCLVVCVLQGKRSQNSTRLCNPEPTRAYPGRENKGGEKGSR
jgi:hypothetical protein